MSAVADFFSQHIITVYFIYGLSFFSMGLAVALEAEHSSELILGEAEPLAALPYCTVFMVGRKAPFDTHPYLLRANLHLDCAAVLLLLAASFLMLVVFGARLIA